MSENNLLKFELKEVIRPPVCEWTKIKDNEINFIKENNRTFVEECKDFDIFSDALSYSINDKETKNSQLDLLALHILNLRGENFSYRIISINIPYEEESKVFFLYDKADVFPKEFRTTLKESVDLSNRTIKGLNPKKLIPEIPE